METLFVVWFKHFAKTIISWVGILNEGENKSLKNTLKIDRLLEDYVTSLSEENYSYQEIVKHAKVMLMPFYRKESLKYWIPNVNNVSLHV